MRFFSLSYAERDLNRQLEGPEGKALLAELNSKIKGSGQGRLENWTNARNRVVALGAYYSSSDWILVPLVRIGQEQPSEVTYAALMYVMWRELVWITKKTRQLDDGLGDSFAEVSWFFIKALLRIDLADRGARVGQKLLNDTLHDVRLSYRPPEKAPKFHFLDDEEQEDKPDSQIPSRTLEMASAEFRISRDWTIQRLRSHVQAGSLSRSDFQVLLGCHLYGYSIDHMAVHMGITYETAKKRRCRAVKKVQKIDPTLSPSAVDSPLFLVTRNTQKEVAHG